MYVAISCYKILERGPWVARIYTVVFLLFSPSFFLATLIKMRRFLFLFLFLFLFFIYPADRVLQVRRSGQAVYVKLVERFMCVYVVISVYICVCLYVRVYTSILSVVVIFCVCASIMFFVYLNLYPSVSAIRWKSLRSGLFS
jgi:hypothetical protein